MKILVADDHHIVRQGLLALIQAANVGTIIADVDSGEQAWRYIQSHQPDIAILDITMGEVSGLSVCHRIKAHSLKTRVILLTMHSDIKVIDSALEAGAHGYLLKSDAFNSLTKAIQSVQAGRRYLSADNQSELQSYRNNKTDFDLTIREKEIIHHISLGQTNKEIGKALFISAKTVDAHRTRVMKKLGFKKTAQLVRFAIEQGLSL
ncbi:MULTISPECIES: response regulator transcription factor [unclassified Pseudoalteromonas]|uniref:response regulator transcription factor n=1 Tax=unclassified Pseudoalteromonas TaxID=194690 RepID=UPI0020971D10|nr:response regulator transcription factor [Pseudoalteromonas sp. XMcav2-N]MCO7189773.1 response regulator transcription factor [Pseudoalteromonas sp. XMcav2-N]